MITGDKYRSDLSLKQPSPLNILLKHKQISALEKHTKWHTCQQGERNKGCLEKQCCLHFSVFLNGALLLPCRHFLFDTSRAAVVSTAVNVSNQDCLLSLSIWEHHICSWFVIGGFKPDILKLQCWRPVSAIFENMNIPRIFIFHLLLRAGIVIGVEHDSNNKRGWLGVYVFFCVRVIIQPE